MTKQEERDMYNDIAIECHRLALKILRADPITDNQIDYALELIRVFDNTVSSDKQE